MRTKKDAFPSCYSPWDNSWPIMLFLPNRSSGPELIDLPPESYSLSEFTGNLADIRKVNRYLGDCRAMLSFLSELVWLLRTSLSRPVKVLDVATGSADIPVAIVRWARSQGIPISVTAVDNNPLAIHEATEFTRGYREITVAVADGFSLPFVDGSFDIVLCSKTLHHFGEEDTIRLLKEIKRVSAHGYIVMDIRRSWMAWALIFLLTRLFTRNRLTRYDGPLSVLRSYTVSELNVLAKRAGLASLRMEREPFWLIVMSGRNT